MSSLSSKSIKINDTTMFMKQYSDVFSVHHHIEVKRDRASLDRSREWEKRRNVGYFISTSIKFACVIVNL